ncbi:hypothetical protein FXO26_26005 [Pseudomonas synxantha]|uniref:Tox-PLDMTX domain-containing protein n=2 Tax=Pseudomonas synxantha TaxID=47883 RepID=A0A5D3G3T0_9PSED|nr:hypothetical protein FXO26_26005 [Pseudomonas synxantha]
MMESKRLKELITGDPEIAKCMLNPRDECFDCAVKVARILRANNVRHRIVGMLIWEFFSRSTDTHFVVAVYDLDDSLKRDNPDEPFIVDPTSAQFLECGPLFEFFHDWRCQLIEGTALGRKLIKLKEYDNPCQARHDLGLFYDLPSEFDGGCLTTPIWYIQYRNDTTLAESRDDSSSAKAVVSNVSLFGMPSVIRILMTLRKTFG